MHEIIYTKLFIIFNNYVVYLVFLISFPFLFIPNDIKVLKLSQYVYVVAFSHRKKMIAMFHNMIVFVPHFK